MHSADKRRGWQQRIDAKKQLQVQAFGIIETAAKKVKVVNPGARAWHGQGDDRCVQSERRHQFHLIYSTYYTTALI